MWKKKYFFIRIALFAFLNFSSVCRCDNKWRYVPLNSLTIGDIFKGDEKADVATATTETTTKFNNQWWTLLTTSKAKKKANNKKKRPLPTARPTPTTTSTSAKPATTRKAEPNFYNNNIRHNLQDGSGPGYLARTPAQNSGSFNIFHVPKNRNKIQEQIKVTTLQVRPQPTIRTTTTTRPPKRGTTKKYPVWYLTAFPTTTETAEQRNAGPGNYEEKIPFPSFLQGVSNIPTTTLRPTTTTTTSVTSTTTATSSATVSSSTTTTTTSTSTTAPFSKSILLKKIIELISAQKRTLSQLQGQLMAQRATLDILKDIKTVLLN